MGTTKVQRARLVQLLAQTLTRLRRRESREETRPGPPPGPVWCVVANVVAERPYGEGGTETRRGTKHFAPGAKLYCLPPLWGDGYEKINVVGRHRGSHRYVTMVVRSRWLTNWRAALVYSPHVIGALAGHWDGSERSKTRAEVLVETMLARTAPNVGTVERPQS
jgi:hypothetical protein